jgi:hypothetical protein
MIEVFDEWAAVAKHLDEVNKMADVKERELLKAKQNLYRQELENQRKELYSRISADKLAAIEEEKRFLQRQMGSVTDSANKEVENEKKKKEIAINIMDENIRLKREAVRANKEAEQIQASIELEHIKHVQEEEKVKEELGKQQRVKIVNALKESYNAQENLKKQENDKLKELDKLYCQQHAQKLINDEKYRQRVLYYSHYSSLII